MTDTGSSSGRKHSTPLFWAALLIVLGIVLLLNNFGYLPWGIWGVLWRFWPVVLILIGINFFFGGSRPLVVLLVTIITVLSVLGLAYWMTASYVGVQQTTTFSQPLGNMQKGEVSIEFGAGRLTVDGLPASSDNFVGGAAGVGAVNDLQRSGNTGIIRIKAPAEWWNPGYYSADWNIHLTPRVPIDLSLKTGANETNLDLTNLKIGKLTLETGASRNVIKLPATAGGTDVLIKAGAADIQVIVPAGVSARVRVEGGLVSTNVDASRFPKSGEYYTSLDYATAANRIDLDIRAGAASVTVK